MNKIELKVTFVWLIYIIITNNCFCDVIGMHLHNHSITILIVKQNN